MEPAGWRIALASVIGTSHVNSGLPCQDHAAYALLDADDGPVLVLVVSDGAGSAACAEIGSELTSRALIQLVRTYVESGGRISDLTRETAKTWIARIGAIIGERAEDDGASVREYSGTLLAAIMGTADAAFLQVGDGAIVVSHGEADGWSYLFWPQHGEFANTTNFVVSPDAPDTLEFELAPRQIDEVALFTDGIENLVLHHASRSVHDPFFHNMFGPVRRSDARGLDPGLSEGLAGYLAKPAICERSDDDKTLILATRAPAQPDDDPAPEDHVE
jgi:hypothetical protein